MTYTHIVFDVDGTLLNTEDTIQLALQKTVEEYTGKHYSLQDLEFSLGIPGVEVMRRLGIEDAEAARVRWNDNMVETRRLMHVYPGIENLLAELHKRGYKLGIVTSRLREELNEDFPQFGLEHYFSTIVCADDSETHKPTAGPLLKYMELTVANKEEVLYIGDRDHDMQCADAAGVDFVLANWGAQGRFEGTTSLYVANHPQELLGIIK